MRSIVEVALIICCFLAQPVAAQYFAYSDCPNVPTETKSTFRSVVKSSNGKIFVNERHAFEYALSPQTMRWLHARECAHIVYHDKPQPDGRYTTEQERRADGWATDQICRMSKTADKDILTIERDIKRLESDRTRAIWDDVLGTPRAINLEGCKSQRK